MTDSTPILSSFVCGREHTPDDGVPIHNPSTEEVVARVASDGVEFAEVYAYARNVGGPALRSLGFAERGALLKDASALLREHRDELLELSRINNGTTVVDGSFDIDGGGFAVAYYGSLGKKLGDGNVLADGDGAQLGKTEEFWAGHVLTPRRGVAVHVNAFNFPAWGLLEKLACSILAGVPAIVKPATATALTAERVARILIEGEVFPAGAMQFVCGSTGDLLARLGADDAFAFTGSAETAAKLRSLPNLTTSSARINVEADSLNAAVLAPDVESGSDTWKMFVREVCHEMTHKAGQKCTAVRRIVVPENRLDDVQDDLVKRLSRVVVGDPAEDGVTMGPLATAAQKAEAKAGIETLEAEVTWVGEAPEHGFFVAPTLLRAGGAFDAVEVHRREVFGPVATLMTYSGDAVEGAGVVALAGGTLVASGYSDESDWQRAFVGEVGHTTGRVYLGSSASAPAAMGSGAAMPQAVHGGPGRAGGGEELGGLRGMALYLQRTAVQGARPEVEAVTGSGS